jgi:hypothetical protein
LWHLRTLALASIRQGEITYLRLLDAHEEGAGCKESPA